VITTTTKVNRTIRVLTKGMCLCRGIFNGNSAESRSKETIFLEEECRHTLKNRKGIQNDCMEQGEENP